MEFENVFSDDMKISRPQRRRSGRRVEAKRRRCDRIAQGGRNTCVIDQGIKPNIRHVIRIERQRDSPIEPGGWTADAKVIQPIVLQKSEHLVAAVIRRDERRILFDIVDQPLLMCSQFEVVVLFFEFGDLAIRRIERSIWQAIFISQKGFFLDRIKSFVSFLIKVALAMQLRKDCLHNQFVA